MQTRFFFNYKFTFIYRISKYVLNLLVHKQTYKFLKVKYNILKYLTYRLKKIINKNISL